jgi:hypothetical protein
VRARLQDGAVTLGVMVLVLAAWWCLHELMTGELPAWLRSLL